MTQLSPLMWALLSPLMFFSLAMFTTSTWWSQTPKFKVPSSNKNLVSFPKWPWQ